MKNNFITLFAIFGFSTGLMHSREGEMKSSMPDSFMTPEKPLLSIFFFWKYQFTKKKNKSNFQRFTNPFNKKESWNYLWIFFHNFNRKKKKMEKEIFSYLGSFILSNVKIKWNEFKNSLQNKRYLLLVVLSSGSLISALAFIIYYSYRQKNLKSSRKTEASELDVNNFKMLCNYFSITIIMRIFFQIWIFIQ